MNDLFEFMFSDETAQSGLKSMQESIKAKTSNVFYHYRKLDFGGTATVRFLPRTGTRQTGEVDTKFWVPKKVIELRFANPDVMDSEVLLTIPVMQMYVGGPTDKDPILVQVKALYDEANKEEKAGRDERAKAIRDIASYHWMRGKTLAQGFVNRSTINEQNNPDNPIRMFELNKQIMNIINASILSEDPDTMLAGDPTHGKVGTNFVIKKTKNGDWPNYSTSAFANKSSPLTEEQIAALHQYGLHEMESFLPPRPTDDEYKVLTDIVRTSISGNRDWNPDWEDHFTTIRVYKTNVESDSDDTDSSETVRETKPSVIVNKSTVNEVMSSLNRGRNDESDDSNGEEVNVESVEKTLKVSENPSDIIARLKAKKAATINA